MMKNNVPVPCASITFCIESIPLLFNDDLDFRVVTASQENTQGGLPSHLQIKGENMADLKKKPTRTGPGGKSAGRDRGDSAGDRAVAVGGSVTNGEIGKIHNNRGDAACKFSPLF